MKELGSLYQKSEYFSSTPSFTAPRPVDYYEFVAAAPTSVPSFSAASLLLMTLLATVVGAFVLRRNDSVAR